MVTYFLLNISLNFKIHEKEVKSKKSLFKNLLKTISKM
jgi:hypothetical protein